jgi:hypothetical protein
MGAVCTLFTELILNPKWLKVHFIVIFVGVNVLPTALPRPSPYAPRYSDIQTPTLSETSPYQSDRLFHSKEYRYSTSFYGKEYEKKWKTSFLNRNKSDYKIQLNQNTDIPN